MGTDPFEEFEFKPLTEGLGFHAKKNSGAPAKNNDVLPPTAQKLKARGIDFNEFSAELTKDDSNPFSAPLPRRDSNSAASPVAPTPAISPVDDILNTLQQNRQMEIEMDRRHRAELRQPGKKAITWKGAAPKFAPLFLDGMLITATSLLCLILMLIITHVDLVANLTNPETDTLLYVATASLFATITFVYMVVNRVFLGYTPGEWAYDLRLGQPEEQNQALYIGKVVARQVLLTVTGFIVFPLIGLFTNKDLAGQITRLPLMRKA